MSIDDLQDLELKYAELGEEIQRLRAKPTGVWEPEKSEMYLSVCMSGRLYEHPRKGFSDELTIAHHNCYKTRELAEKASVFQRRSNLVIQACLNVDPDFEPDWNNHNNHNQMRYQFYYCHFSAQWKRPSINLAHDWGGVCVSTKEKADQVLEYLNSQEVK